MNSMTGYGRADLKEGNKEITVEIRSVNNRYRDIFIKSPHSYNGIEDRIRKTISNHLGRGRIEVYVRSAGDSAQTRVICDKQLAREYLSALNELKTLDSMISQNIDLELVAKFPDVIHLSEESPDNDAMWQELEPVLLQALSQLENARHVEGEALNEDIHTHAAVLREDLEKIRELAPKQLLISQENLRQKLTEAFKETGVDENRVLAEAAVLADRLAIDEEIARLDSHLMRLQELCAETKEPVGRRLDFLVQEINREINTIGSKTDSIDIVNLVVEMKGETEKIREQVQNIE